MKHNKLFWMRRITLALFFFGLIAGILRYDGLAVFLAIVIVGDILSDALGNLKSG
ncbi:MAG: hypothetical protein ACYS1A_19460 [Planctomycetota bacterium]|jgi:hypothetical protein